MIRSGIGASCLVLAFCLSAQAQESELRVDTVIVTSPGPQRLAGEMLSNVTAVDREELVADLQGTLGDTLARQPGVSTTYFGAGASRPVMRGLGAERVLVLTNGLGVIDASAASPDHQTGTDGIDAQRVEILRGPAALAYGGQAIGGVVNVIDGLMVDQLPEEAASGQFYSAYNSVNDGTEIAGRGSIRFGNFFLSGSISQRDFSDYDIPGYAETEAFHELEEAEDGEDHDQEEAEETYGFVENSFLSTNTYGVGLSYVAGNGYVGLAVRRQEAEYGLPGHSHHHEEDAGAAAGAHDEEAPFIGLEQTRIDFQAGMNFDHNIVHAIDARFTTADYEHAEFEGPGEIGTQYFTDGYEGRIELDHALAGFNGAIGVQFTRSEFRAEGDETFITPTDSDMMSVFIYEARDWDSGFGIEGGLRVEQVERDNEVFGSREFDLLSSSFGVHQHWDNGFFLGGQVSVTERAPNESELFADGAHLATLQYEVGNAGLDAETGTNFEATARWLGDNLTLGFNLFHTDFDGFIYLAPGETLDNGVLVDEIDEVPVFLFSQQDAEFSGGELYGTLHFDDGLLGAHWDIDAGLDFVNGSLSGGGNVPYLPPVTFNGDVNADWGMFDAGIGLTLAADQDDPGAGNLPTEGYAVWNLSAGFNLGTIAPELEGGRLFLQARNVTDEDVRYATSVLKDQLPAPGRNIRFGLSAAF